MFGTSGIPPLFYPSAPPPEAFDDVDVDGAQETLPTPAPLVASTIPLIVVPPLIHDTPFQREEITTLSQETRVGKEKEENEGGRALIDEMGAEDNSERTKLLKDGIDGMNVPSYHGSQNRADEGQIHRAVHPSYDYEARHISFLLPPSSLPLLSFPLFHLSSLSLAQSLSSQSVSSPSKRGNVQGGDDVPIRKKEEGYPTYFPFFTLFVIIMQAALLAIMIWRSGGLESPRVNPLLGPSGT